jgi:glutathione S-transferase
MMAQLDTHFAAHSYLLGGRPTLADFGLVGTMYGHLGRDPWPRREMVARYPHLRAWIDRMANPADRRMGPLFPDDEIPPTLLPIVQQVVQECVPWFDGIAAEINQVLAERPGRFPPGRPLPRKLGDQILPTAQGTFKRAALPFTLWLAQRPRDVFTGLDAVGQQRVKAQLAALDGLGLLAHDWPRLARHGLGATLAEQA